VLPPLASQNLFASIADGRVKVPQSTVFHDRDVNSLARLRIRPLAVTQTDTVRIEDMSSVSWDFDDHHSTSAFA
jgi:hypothetical protein